MRARWMLRLFEEQTRHQTLSIEQAPDHIRWLTYLQAQYKVFAEIEKLQSKMQRWQRPESLAVANENMKEYEVPFNFAVGLK